MLRDSRRRVVALTAALSAGVFVLASVPAEAVVPVIPDWPSGGHAPESCATARLTGDTTTWTFSYTDTATPTVEDVTLNGGTQLVVGPQGATRTFQARISQPCGGVRSASLWLSHNGAPMNQFPTDPTTSSAFHNTFVSVDLAFPTDAGSYVVPTVQVKRRYDSFVLDQDSRLISSVASFASPYDLAVGSWSFRTMWILRRTTLSASQSATTVRKGRTVRISGSLRYATNAGYVADNGEKVLAQIKVGTRWVTKATLTASSTGAVSYSFAPTRTTLVRFVHAAVHSGRLTAAVTSAVRTVRVS